MLRKIKARAYAVRHNPVGEDGTWDLDEEKTELVLCEDLNDLVDDFECVGRVLQITAIEEFFGSDVRFTTNVIMSIDKRMRPDEKVKQ